MANALAFEEIHALRARLEDENLALKEEIDLSVTAGGMIGASSGLREVLERVQRVAHTDSTVLITGETGTGKELVARAIHRASARAARAMIKVNCAAFAEGLVASELFGHEKGAFTGALERRRGRFELAAGGTIILDEVGELPPAVQVTLLRVLQEGEFERVGGSTALRTDARVVAVSNRNLEVAVRDGRLRSDLFFRLNVFPIHVPALRERPQDIALIAGYYAHHYGRRLGKDIRGISADGMAALHAYSWPGNVRELQNVVERAAILSRGSVLELGDLEDAIAPPRADIGPSVSQPLIAAPGSVQGSTVSPDLRDIVVFLDARQENMGALDLAVALAAQHQASLIAVFNQPSAVSQPEMFARGTAIPDAIRAADERLKVGEQEWRARFEMEVVRHSVRGEWRPFHDRLASDLVMHARYADLALVTRENPLEREHSTPGLREGPASGLPETLVLSSARPIVVLPPRSAPTHVRRILVGWNASPEATRAVASAMPLIVRAEAVEVVVVVRGDCATRHGEEPGADIARHLARHGAQVDVRRLSSGRQSVGHVLLSRAAEFGADLLVMGACGHSRLSEWVFGGATRTALQEAPVPVTRVRDKRQAVRRGRSVGGTTRAPAPRR